MKDKIKDRLGEQWTHNQFSNHLQHLIYWVRNGYQLTDTDKDLIQQLGSCLQEQYCSR